MKNTPSNKKLYQQVTNIVKSRVKKWPSAYASGQVVQEYKRRGGTYIQKKNKQLSNLNRWYQEEWIDVCKWPDRQPCGRKQSDLKDYPYCRPLKRINEQTPKTVQELSTQERKQLCTTKRKNPLKRMKSQRK